jgi:hypothetical protein
MRGALLLLALAACLAGVVVGVGAGHDRGRVRLLHPRDRAGTPAAAVAATAAEAVAGIVPPSSAYALRTTAGGLGAGDARLQTLAGVRR